MKKIIFSVLIIFILLPRAFAGGGLHSVTLQLNWKYQFEFAGFIVAKEKGFFKKNGLDVKIMEFDTNKNESSILDDVINKKADFAILSSILIQYAAKNKKVEAILPILQHSPEVLAALDGDIKTLNDLNNKKIAISDRYVFVRAMLRANKIRFYKEPIRYSFKPLLTHKISAMIAYTSNGLLKDVEKNHKLIIFDPRDYGFDGYDDIVFTSKDFADANQELVFAFKKAVIEGWEYTFQHVDEAVDLIYNKYNTQHRSRETLKYEAKKIVQLSGYLEHRFGYFDIHRVRNIANIYAYMLPGRYNMDNLNHFIFNRQYLTKEDVNYLLKKKSIKICVLKNQFPIEAYKDNTYTGIVAEIAKKITKQLPVRVEIVPIALTDDTEKYIKENRCDVKSIMIKKYSSLNGFMRVVPYLKGDLAVITKTDKPYILDIYYLGSKKLIVTYKPILRYLKDNFPFLNVVLVEDRDRAFDLIKNNKAFGLVVSSAVSNLLIKIYGYQQFKVNLRISKPKIEYGFGILKSEPKLYSIFDKLVKNLDRDSIMDIIERYDIATYRINNNRYLWAALILLGVMLFVLLFYSIIYMIKNKQLEMMINSSINGIVVVKNNKIITANQVAVRAVGLEDVKDLKGRDVFEFAAESEMEKIKGYTNSGDEHYTYQSRYRRNDGSTFPVLTKGTFIGKNTRIVYFMDLTELQEAQKRLEELNATLENKVRQEVEKNRKQQLILIQKDRLAQMGEILSMIAHQWRQPLNILSLTIQKVVLHYKLKGGITEEDVRILEFDTQKQIRNMSEIIDDFRDFFKPEKEKTVFDISKAVTHTVSIIHSLLDSSSVNLEMNIEENLMIEGFPNEFGQSLINIINNAKDALNERNISEKSITISCKRIDDEVIVEVEDNGGGIKEDIIERIFEPYFSTKDKKVGTGLGLYMSKIIIEEHMGGSITVENTQKGALFIISFKAVNA